MSAFSVCLLIFSSWLSIWNIRQGWKYSNFTPIEIQIHERKRAKSSFAYRISWKLLCSLTPILKSKYQQKMYLYQTDCWMFTNNLFTCQWWKPGVCGTLYYQVLCHRDERRHAYECILIFSPQNNWKIS